MRLSRVLRPAWSLTALGLALSLVALPMTAKAADDDDDNGDTARQGTVRIYGGDDDAQGGYLGVQVQDVTRALQRARNLPTDEGALVSRVEDDSPADQAGIRRGDVITEVDRHKIDSSADLIRVVRGVDAGTRVRVTLWRSGSLRTVNVQVGERPKDMPGMQGMPPGMRTPSDNWMHPGSDDRDVQRQIQELRDQVRELQQQIRALQDELRSSRQEIRSRDRDNDRSRDRDDEDDN